MKYSKLIVLVSVLFGVILVSGIIVVYAPKDKGKQKGFLPAPAYDSGWISMECDERLFLEHGLDTTEVFVYVIGRNPDCAGWTGAHQSNFGSDNAMGRFTGAHWDNLTDNTIRIVRGRDDDTVDINWKEIRVQMWKIQEP